MPTVSNILKVVDAFRRLDKAYLKFYSTKYPGNFHAIREISSTANLPRTTVQDVLQHLQNLNVIERKDTLVSKYRLKVWEFTLKDGLRIEVELNRVIAYLP